MGEVTIWLGGGRAKITIEFSDQPPPSLILNRKLCTVQCTLRRLQCKSKLMGEVTIGIEIHYVQMYNHCMYGTRTLYRIPIRMCKYLYSQCTRKCKILDTVGKSMGRERKYANTRVSCNVVFIGNTNMLISRDSELMLYYFLNYALFFTELCFKMLYFWQGCFILKVM